MLLKIKHLQAGGALVYLLPFPLPQAVKYLYIVDQQKGIIPPKWQKRYDLFQMDAVEDPVRCCAAFPLCNRC